MDIPLLKRATLINIGIVEPDAVNQQKLKNYLNLQPEFVCTLATPTVSEFVTQVNVNYMVLVIILCVSTEITSQVLCTKVKKLKLLVPEAEVILFTDQDDTKMILAALRCGALGYLQRNTPLLALKEILLGVALGGAFLSPHIARKIADYFLDGTQTTDFDLTTREKQIIICLTDGLSYKLIAANMSVSMDTVRFHLRNIYKKLKVNSKTEVISKVLRKEIDLD